jgi:hypothetical protein
MNDVAEPCAGEPHGAPSSSGATTTRRSICDVTERQAQDGLPVRVRSGETPGSPVVKPPCVVERPGAKRGGSDWPVRSESEVRQASSFPPAVGGSRGCRAGRVAAKAMEDVWDLGADVEEPSGVVGVERSEGCPGNWGGPPRPRRCGRREAVLSITGDGKWQAAERESEGAVVLMMGRTTQPARREGPLLHRCTSRMWRNPGECRAIG